MLTLAEIESALQIEYELQLEALGEQAFRDLLAEPAGFSQLAPRHSSDAEVRTIAEATLAESVARKAPRLRTARAAAVSVDRLGPRPAYCRPVVHGADRCS
jgi:hypothetical protein